MKSKLTFMNSTPEITDEEIRRMMDFDKVLQEHQAHVDRVRRIRKVSYAIIGGVIAVVAVLMLTTGNDQSSGIEPAMRTHPPVAPDSASTAPAPLTSTPEPVEKQEPQPKRKVEEKQPVSQAPSAENAALPAEAIYVQATPVDGYDALYGYFAKELTYPAAAIPDSTEGVVTVVFTISSEGAPTDIRIENSLGAAFDAQARSVIEKMPAWNPATYNGKPVASKISLPLTFTLKK